MRWPEKRPRLSLVPTSPVPEPVQAARVAELEPWVQTFRERHSHLWPERATGVQGPVGTYKVRHPWPTCWPVHAALVTELTCLKLRTEAIEAGNLPTAAALGGGFDRWTRHVRDITATMVQEIGRVCMTGLGHRSSSVPLHEQVPYGPSLRVISPERDITSWRDMVQTNGDEVER